MNIKIETIGIIKEMVHRKENQPQSAQRAQSVDVSLCVLCVLCGFSNQKISLCQGWK